MKNTGHIFPASTATPDVTAGVGQAWTNPGNIVADDGNDATNNAPIGGSKALSAYNFGLHLPSAAVVLGIEVRVEASEHSTGSETLFARLRETDPSGALQTYNNGSYPGSAVRTASITGTTKAVYTYGGPTDTWNLSLDWRDINRPGFGVMLNFDTAHDVRIDYVTICVYYEVRRQRSLFSLTRRLSP